MVSGYLKSTGIPWVDGLLTGPWVLGRHKGHTLSIDVFRSLVDFIVIILSY